MARIPPPATRVRNDLFDPGKGLERGRPAFVEAAWYLCKCAFFLTPLPFPSAFKRALLRAFGAKVGRRVVIKPRVNIHLPWKLSVGDHTWLGEEVCILNLEPVTLGAQCCISQRAFLCTGNHDYTEPDMPFRNAPIVIQDGAWVGAQTFVAPGVTVGEEAVISAGAVVTSSLPAGMVCRGNPCIPVKPRWPQPASAPGREPSGAAAPKAPAGFDSVPEHLYRNILGVRFFAGDAHEAVEIGSRGGLVVAPAAPALVDLARDPDYRQALAGADLAITDSGFLVLLWNLMHRDRIHRVSGLEYLRLLLASPDFQTGGKVLWVMPSQDSMERNLAWLNASGHAFTPQDCHLAPKYPRGGIVDEKLIELVRERAPRHVVVCVGGGIQEKLGLYLKSHSSPVPAIHCIGAAIGFLSGDQVRIPAWADRTVLGWFFRCVSNPQRFVPRYARALALPMMLWRYGSRMPDLSA